MRIFSVSMFTVALALATCGAASAEVVGLRPGIGAEAVDETATASIPTPAPRAEEQDRYAALGIRAGSFILYPSLTTTTGYTTNASGSAGAGGSGFGLLEPELIIQSDWARHDATLSLRGSYEKFFDATSPDKPTAAADATARIDFENEWTADLAAGAIYDQQSISDAGFPTAADTPPGVIGLSSSAALNGNFGRGTFTIAGNVDRTMYENATISGVPFDQGDRTNTVFGGRLRVGYEATASLTPFVEGEVSRRVFDRTVDTGGNQRSGTGLAARVGVDFDRGPLLTGEIAVGTVQEDLDDPTLASLSALSVDGSLVWSPTELTTVTFDASTAINPTADPTSSSGSVVYDASVDIAYAWRRNFTVHWTGEINHEHFQGTEEVDMTYDLGMSATWKINRSLHLTAGYIHEWVVSTDPAVDYQSDAVKVGLRAQR